MNRMRSLDQLKLQTDPYLVRLVAVPSVYIIGLPPEKFFVMQSTKKQNWSKNAKYISVLHAN